MKTYLEIKVPIRYDESWFIELRKVATGLTVKWQEGFYHITMAFIDETPENIDLCPLLEKHLNYAHAPIITFDKLDVFTARSGMYIIHLTATKIPEDFLALTEVIRSEMRSIGCRIDSDFRLHVTLGRVKDPGIHLTNLKRITDFVPLLPFSITLSDVDYRVFRGRTIYETKLGLK